MNINQIMSELAQYIRMQEEAAAMVESLKKPAQNPDAGRRG
jgi:hypothetical protein